MDPPLRSSLLGAECLHWPGGSTLLYFIPGNPGLVDYYLDFLSSLSASTMEFVSIYTVSHYGHSARYPNKGKPYSLSEQIQHHIACLNRIAEGRKIIVAGHSVGAFIACQVAKKINVQQVYGLFPTISDIQATPNGRKLSAIFNPLPRRILSSMAGAIPYILPIALLQSMISLQTGQDSHSAQVTTQLLTSSTVVESALYMAYTEMQDIRELDADFLTNGPTQVNGVVGPSPRIRLYYGKTDGWVPEKCWKQVEDVLATHHGEKDASTRAAAITQVQMCEQGMPHAFCLNHGAKMASIVAFWLHDAKKFMQ